MATPDLPLLGTRVLDFSWVFTGPLCTRYLALLGAEVIKVESLKRPDLSTREWLAPPLNVNKKSCTIDMSTAKGKELARSLAMQSDVVIENFSTGVMERLGLGYDLLRALKRDLIVVSSSPVGRTGPARFDPGYGSMIQCLTGWGALSSYPDGAPKEFGGLWADPLAGTTLAFVVLSALHRRALTGEGRFIDLSMTETIVAGLPEPVMATVMGGPAPVPLGNRDVLYAPQGCYPCRGTDQWLALSVTNDEEWTALCAAIGRPELAADPRFSDGLARWRNQDEIDPVIADWTRGRDGMSLMRDLQAAGVPAGAVHGALGLVQDPQLQARGLFARIEGEGNGFTIGIPWTVDGARVETLAPCPPVGADNEFVFGEVLGLSPDVIRSLIDEKIIY